MKAMLGAVMAENRTEDGKMKTKDGKTTDGKTKATSDRPLVCITGATGYLGSTICQLFLSEGTWNVRGTVRDKDNDRKMNYLK